MLTVYIHKDQGQVERLLLVIRNARGNVVSVLHPTKLIIKRLRDLRLHNTEEYDVATGNEVINIESVENGDNVGIQNLTKDLD